MLLKSLVTLVFSLFPAIAMAYTQLPRNYEDLSGQEKEALLWNRVVENEYRGTLPSDWPGTLEVLSALNPTQLFGRPFQYCSDEMPSPRKKAVHTYGAVGQVQFVPAQGRVVSGLLRGAFGLVRLSVGTDPKKGLVPGMALKFFVDHEPSVNLHVMNSLSPQDSAQFFEKPFRNVVKVPILGEFTLSITRFLGTLSDGSEDDMALSNEVVVFQPTREAAQEYVVGQDFRRSLAAMQPVTLYKVYVAQDSRSTPYYVGDLNLVSQLIPSQYGDEMLFFKHDK